MDRSELGSWLDAHDVRTVRTEGVTVDGLLVGKVLARRKFEHSLPLGNAITELVFGYDVGGTPYLAWWDDWRRDALGDVHQRPDLSTLVAPGFAPAEARCIVDHVDLDGAPLPICPRSVLRTQVEHLAAAGYTAKAAFELEFMVFAESPAQARRQGFRHLTPLTLPRALGYHIDNTALATPFMSEVCRRLDDLSIPWEGWHDEAAPGQLELNLEPADPIAAADHAVRVRQTVREVAHDCGRTVTFMAKPGEEYGNGLHVHHSLLAGTDPVFHDADAADHHSALLRRWLAGLMATIDGATSIMTPTVNAYRRMVGWAAAPVTPTWAEDNKSTAVRLLTRTPAATRIEHRVGAADANPYLVLAVVLAGGLAGLAEDLPMPDAFRPAGWGMPPEMPHLPNTISTAADALAADGRLRAQLGGEFVDYWVNTRRWEWLMFHTTGGDATATTVGDWELARYFEVI